MKKHSILLNSIFEKLEFPELLHSRLAELHLSRPVEEKTLLNSIRDEIKSRWQNLEKIFILIPQHDSWLAIEQFVVSNISLLIGLVIIELQRRVTLKQKLHSTELKLILDLIFIIPNFLVSELNKAIKFSISLNEKLFRYANRLYIAENIKKPRRRIKYVEALKMANEKYKIYSPENYDRYEIELINHYKKWRAQKRN